MKKTIITFLIFLYVNILHTQTTTQFVINGDFETTTLKDTLSCSMGSFLNYSNLPPYPLITDSCFLEYWYSSYTSDFLYSTMNGVPWNAYHTPTNKGNVHCAGINTLSASGSIDINLSHKETLHCELKNSLINNCNYQISFSALFYYEDSSGYKQFCSEIGVLLTDTIVKFEGSNHIANTSPSFESPSNLFFNDTSIFVNYSSNYIASGNELFLTIGNFKNFNNSTLDGNPLVLNYSNFDSFIVYVLFLDNISILPIGYEDLVLDLGTDTNLCNGAINLNAYEPRFEHYLWSTGDTTPNISITQGGTYVLEADYGCGKLIDSIFVAEMPSDTLVNEPDTLYLCPKQLPYTLSANQNYNNLYWNTGDTSQSISITTEGLYTAYLEYFCISITDPTYIIIKQNPQNIIPFSDTTVCNSFTYALQDTFTSYNWSNGSTSNIFTTTQTGSYWLQAGTNCFSFQDTFSVTIETLQTGENTQILEKCPDDFPINLQASFTAPIYNWSNGNKNQNISITDIKNDTFSVQYSNICGLAKDIFYVKILPDYFSEPITVLRDSCTEKNYYVVAIQNQDSLATYLWNNSIQGFSFVGENQNITLQAFTACLSYEQEIILPQCPEQIKFALPTAFSPNNDGINDNFGLLYLNPKYSLEYLEIYNRWGEKIYSFKDKNDKWQGFYKNKKQEIGNYIYILKLKELDEIFSAGVLLVR